MPESVVGIAGMRIQTAFAAGGTFEWDPGVRLVYNRRFSRPQGRHWHSYSVPLIPDIALRVPSGPNAGLHLFDAKFRVKALTDVGLAAGDKDADDEKARERAGSFKRADIYKMHAYRDAIPDARSVWILYPGGEFRFFGVPGNGGLAGGRVVSSAEGLPEEVDGVGAIPVAPVVGGEGGDERGMAGACNGVLRAILGRILPSGPKV
ncbi:MAG: nuclease domain-containing protein [Gemmatimonadetes bacterium]|nr:nuclease domain-containing protein [Gemmatimonadota bacterium]